MTQGTSRDNLLTTLAALLDFEHVEAARLIIAEVQHRSLGEPEAAPLRWMDDDDFEDLREQVDAEAFRRERIRRPHTGDRWCRRAQRVSVGDVVCLPKKEGEAPTARERGGARLSRAGLSPTVRTGCFSTSWVVGSACGSAPATCSRQR